MSLTEATKKLGVPHWWVRGHAMAYYDRKWRRPQMLVGFRRRGRIYLGGAGFRYLRAEWERLQNKKRLQAAQREGVQCPAR
jgi:hypothetical protein